MIVTTFPKTVRVIEHTLIPLQDGTRLEPESAPPEKPTVFNRGDLRIERIDRLGLEPGTQLKSWFDIDEDDPLSAVAERRKTLTMARGAWQIRVETQIHLSSTATAFALKGSLRAWEGENEVCHREWDRSVPRDV